MRTFNKYHRIIAVILFCISNTSSNSQGINYSNSYFIHGEGGTGSSQYYIICSDQSTMISFLDSNKNITSVYLKNGAGCDTIKIDSIIISYHILNPLTLNQKKLSYIVTDDDVIMYEAYLYSPNENNYPSHFHCRLIPPPNMAGTSNINLGYKKQFYYSLYNTNFLEYGDDLILIGISDTTYIRVYPNWQHPLLNGNNYYSFNLQKERAWYEYAFNNNISPTFPTNYPPCIITVDSSNSIRGNFITRTGMYGFGNAISNEPWGLSTGFRFYPLAYEFLGKNYHTVPHATRAGDSLLAIAFHDSTVISLNGVVSTINRGEVFRTLLDSPGVWQSNHPFSLVQISRHQQEDSVLYSSLFAYSVHPDSALISSTWYTTEIVPDSTPGEQSYLNLISPTNGVAYVKLDGVSLSSYFVPYASDTAWSYAQIPVTSVQHKLEADSGVLAYAYQYSLGCGVGFYVGGLEMKNTVTSVPSPIIKTDITIYPNPAHQTLNIDFGDSHKNVTQVTVKLFTVEGKCILNSTSKNRRNLSLDISTLANGIYFLEIILDDRKVSKKFVKN